MDILAPETTRTNLLIMTDQTSMVYIVMVNWNNWRDTVECLESLLSLRSVEFKVVVCDNSSTDGSIEKITEWAAGDYVVDGSNAPIEIPLIPKPVPLKVIGSDEVGLWKSEHEEKIIVVRHDANQGFASGCNIGMRLALRDEACRYVWLLNNDTVVDPEALVHLVDLASADVNIGMCGSLLLYYHRPCTIQAKGGAKFNRWFATSSHIGEGEHVGNAGAHQSEAVDYIVGASMLVSRQFVADVGLMDEDYFLYFEEIDWAYRKGGYRLACSMNSVVYHKEGGSTNLNNRQVQYGVGTEVYLLRNRIIFTKKNFPLSLPIVFIRLLMVFVRSLDPKRWGRAKIFFKRSFWRTGK